MKFSRNGQWLLAGGGRGGHSGKVVLWDVKTGKRVAEVGSEYDIVLAEDRASAIEAALTASFTPDAAGAVKMSADNLNSDLHADAAYRAHLISVMAKRAVARAK